MVRKALRRGLAPWGGLFLLALAGCASRQLPQPAMVAMGQFGDFGYAERRLAEDRYEVSYTTPLLRTSTSSGERSREVEVQKEQARDLALWRAAQLAQRAGYAALRIDSDNRDADVTIRRESDPFDRPYPYPYPYLYGRGEWPFYSPYYGPGYGYGYRTEATARITSTLRVTFLRQPTDDSLDAAATVKDLSARYASATYPGRDG